MKRIIATGSVAALALVGFAGTASAAPQPGFTPGTPECFGKVHKTVNSGVLGVDNVGEFIKLVGGGQAKNTAAKGLCAS